MSLELAAPPHSAEAEQSVLGALMLDPSSFDRVADILAPNDFFVSQHGAIFTAISSLAVASKPCDVLSVHEVMRRNDERYEGLPYLGALSQSVFGASNVRRHAEIIREKAMQRALIAAADEAATIARDSGDPHAKLDAIAALFAKLERRSVRNAPRALSELLVKAIDRYQELAEGKRSSALSTGIAPLDRVLNGGLRAGKVYGIAARPSVGKSALARSICLSAAKQGCKTLLLSQEMSGDEVADCAVSQLAAIESDRLQTGKFDDHDWTSLSQAIDENSSLPLYIDDQGALTIAEIRIKARMVKGLGALVIDYLQLTSSALTKANRNEQIEEVSRGLKALAMSMGIPIIVLSQLNRDVERRADKEPQLADLRDSGAIEQDLDAVAMLWTAREFDGGARRIVGCKVPKHRGGPKGRFALEFRASTYRWYESMASIDPPTRTEMKGGFE